MEKSINCKFLDQNNNSNDNGNDNHKKMQEPFKKITHVIFDMDGVILEQLYEIAYGNVAARFNRTLPFELKCKLSGVPARQNAAFLIRRLSLPLDVDQFIAIYQAECVCAFSRFKRIPLMPGAERLVRHLHRHRVPIAIVTSTRRVNFELKVAPYRELFSLFDHIVVTPDDAEIRHGKPHPEPFLVGAARFSAPPIDAHDMSRVLVIEDSIAGVQAARDAGMRCVWIPDRRHSDSILNSESTSTIYRLESLQQFRPELFGLPPFD